MNRLSVLQISNIVVLIVTLAFNFLSQGAVTLFGVEFFAQTSQQAGESRALFFLPAGYVFAIWGIIYIGMIAFVIYQGRPSQRDGEVVRAVGPWFIIGSLVGNIGWLFLFLNDQLFVSNIAIVTLLVSLIIIYVRLGIGKRAVSNAERWAVHIPFSIYLGWVSVATVANTSAWIYSMGNVTSFLGISADVWAVIMMVIAGVLAFAMLFLRNDIAYALVVVWALVGIYARPFESGVFEVIAGLNVQIVHTAAIGIAIVIGIAVVATLFLRRGRGTANPALA
jgi:hypothetical protein